MADSAIDEKTEKALQTIIKRAYTEAVQNFYSTLETELGDMPGMDMDECHFFAYADVGHSAFVVQCFGGSPEFLSQTKQAERFLKEFVLKRKEIRRLLTRMMMNEMITDLGEKTSHQEAIDILMGKSPETEH